MSHLRPGRFLSSVAQPMIESIIYVYFNCRSCVLKLFSRRSLPKFHSKGRKSQSAYCVLLQRAPAAGWLAVALSGMAPAVLGADDPGARALQQHQLQRQQQQDALQLRMQQHQRRLHNPPADARQQQALGQMEADQQQRQQELQYRQGIEPATAQPSDDAGTRHAKAQLEEERAREQSQRQLLRFESEAQRRVEQARREKSRGEIIPAQQE